MVFTFNMCVFKNRRAEVKEKANADVTFECTLRSRAFCGHVFEYDMFHEGDCSTRAGFPLDLENL